MNWSCLYEPWRICWGKFKRKYVRASAQIFCREPGHHYATIRMAVSSTKRCDTFVVCDGLSLYWVVRQYNLMAEILVLVRSMPWSRGRCPIWQEALVFRGLLTEPSNLDNTRTIIIRRVLVECSSMCRKHLCSCYSQYSRFPQSHQVLHWAWLNDFSFLADHVPLTCFPRLTFKHQQ